MTVFVNVSNTRVQRSFCPHAFTCSQFDLSNNSTVFSPCQSKYVCPFASVLDSFSCLIWQESQFLSDLALFETVLYGTLSNSFYKNYSISFVNISTSCLSWVQFCLSSCHRRGKEAISEVIVSNQYHEVDHRSAAPKPVKSQSILFFQTKCLV